jgi:hypothetical protein
LYASDDLRYPLFLLQDASSKLFRWQVGNVFFRSRILTVEVAAVGDQFGRRNLVSEPPKSETGDGSDF